jgi:GntR family transcriptional regulator
MNEVDYPTRLDQTTVLVSWYIGAMFIRLHPATGQPVYLQVMQQIRHAAESGVLQAGDQLPSIRALAGEIVVSPNTVAKAYAELEHEGLIELRQGAGAFLTDKAPIRQHASQMKLASAKLEGLIQELQRAGLSSAEIRRVFETALLGKEEATQKA